MRAIDFRLQRCVYVEKMRQSGVVAVNKVRETRRRMCDKTRRKDVTTKLSSIDRGYSTSEAFGYGRMRRWNYVERANDGKVVRWRNR